MKSRYHRIYGAGHCKQSGSRERLYGIISEAPGITFGGIMDAANIGNGTASYHLHRLERSGRIVSRTSGRCRLFWTSDFKGLRRLVKLPPVSRKIIALLRESRNHQSVGRIATALEVSHQRVSYNLRSLEQAGMVKRVRQGRKTLCFLVDM